MEFCDYYVSIDLFVFIECDNILNNRQEILLLDVMRYYLYFGDIEFDCLDDQC